MRNFDVDWLRGQSVGIYPVHNSSPEPVVAELEKIMDSGDGRARPQSGEVPGHRAAELDTGRGLEAGTAATAAIWIARLDVPRPASTGVKVYKRQIRRRQADRRTADRDIRRAAPSALDSAANQIAPGSGATALSAVDRLTGGLRTGNSDAAALPRRLGRTLAAAVAAAGLDERRRVDRRSGRRQAGALCRACASRPTSPTTRCSFMRARRTTGSSSARWTSSTGPKLQVAIDVTIAEVTLNDDLSYGVQFFLNNRARLAEQFHSNRGQSSQGVATPISPNLPGFNLVVGNATSPHAIISALHQYTDVKILSNPSLVVVDNQPATLEVGDQVPVSTGTATVLSANNSVVSTVDYKNTGIILHVLPRVNSNGTVLLDIEQEISSVPNGGNSASTNANLTPTISERKVKSEFSVASGQTVLLAGLDQREPEHHPYRHSRPRPDPRDRAPLSRRRTSRSSRTELILFIRPQIIHDGADASVVAEELRSKMRGGNSVAGPAQIFAPHPSRTLQ